MDTATVSDALWAQLAMSQSSAPLRAISSHQAFANLKQNGFATWPRADDPDNRFAAVADPAFEAPFQLEPGQRIFTIGSCFARNIEGALEGRGFDIPARRFVPEAAEIGTDSILNNYVPASIAPQIRWAFGLEDFDAERHCLEVRRDGFIDLQLVSSLRPLPLEAVIARRAKLGELYRELARSHVVLITLGLVEAWFDRTSGRYINMTPPKAYARKDPARFELHVLEYNQIAREMFDLVDLLRQVCPADHRVILTVSPVPLMATFTTEDVSVANMYSKSVLRTAAETVVAKYDHAVYFPSYESVLLTDRALAYGDDQVHVTPQLVRFNVDRMIRAYVRDGADTSVSAALEEARQERKAGNLGNAIRVLRAAAAANPDSTEVAVALADVYLKRGSGRLAEQLLTRVVSRASSAAAHLLLARYYHDIGRFEVAAVQAELAAHTGEMKLQTTLARVETYLKLQRSEEALALLATLRYVAHRGPQIAYWKALHLQALGRLDEAEENFRASNEKTENASFMTAYADHLAKRGRHRDASEWIDRALRLEPTNRDALALRARLALVRLKTGEGGTGWARRLREAWRYFGRNRRRAIEPEDPFA